MFILLNNLKLKKTIILCNCFLLKFNFLFVLIIAYALKYLFYEISSLLLAN